MKAERVREVPSGWSAGKIESEDLRSTMACDNARFPIPCQHFQQHYLGILTTREASYEVLGPCLVLLQLLHSFIDLSIMINER